MNEPGTKPPLSKKGIIQSYTQLYARVAKDL
jgi:hypothetical protein